MEGRNVRKSHDPSSQQGIKKEQVCVVMAIDTQKNGRKETSIKRSSLSFIYATKLSPKLKY